VAFNAAVTQNKIAWVPSGIYKVTNLVIPNGSSQQSKLAIQGEGMTVTWFKGQVSAGSYQNISNLKIGDLGTTFKFTTNSQYTDITNTHFRGGGAVDTSGHQEVILIGADSGANNYIHNITFTGCEVERNLGTVYDYTNYGNGLNYNNISIYARATANSTHVTDIKFENCHFGVSNGEPGHNTGSSRMNIEVWQNDIPGATQVQGFQHIDFINNVFEAADGTNLDFAGAHNWSTGYCLSGNSIISGNLFKGNGLDSDHPWQQDLCLEPMCDMQITNNTFIGSSGSAGVNLLSSPSGYGYSQNNVFKSNTIDLTAPSEVTIKNVRHLQIKAKNTEYSYNTIKMNESWELMNIELGGSNKIINNTFTINFNQETRLISFGHPNIAGYNPSTLNIVSGNVYYFPNQTPGIYVFGGSIDNSVSNNKFYGKKMPYVSDLTNTLQFLTNTFTLGAPSLAPTPNP
ncbi:MAG: hypothetical protein WCP03_04025, partial [Candidatus Saccharibacteria bacterium]